MCGAGSGWGVEVSINLQYLIDGLCGQFLDPKCRYLALPCSADGILPSAPKMTAWSPALEETLYFTGLILMANCIITLQ